MRRRHITPDRRTWLIAAEQWDGVALITIMGDPQPVRADEYKRCYCEPVMEDYDSLPPAWRAIERGDP